MPRYEITSPDGRRFEVTAPEGASQEEVLSYAQSQFYAQQQAVPEEKPEGGFIPAVKAGASELAADIAALAGRTGIVSPEAAEKYIEEQKAYQKRTFAPTEEGWTEAPWTKFKETLGGSLPYMGAPVAAGAAALALPVTGPAAAAIGAAGAGAVSAAQFTGSNLMRQIEEGTKLEETSLGSAAAAAVPQAALDVVGFKMMPGIRKIFSAVGKEIPEEAALAIAKQNVSQVAKDYLQSTGVAMTAEGLTETGQQVLERLQAGLDITDEKARSEYFDSFIGGAVLGGALAPAGRYIERGAQARKEQAAEELAAEERRAEAAKPKLIGYDPESQEPMYVFSDGSVAIGEDAVFARRYQEEAVEPAEPEPPKLLGYSPSAGKEPMYVFSDGSVAIGEDAAFNRRYEPQKLSQEELSAIEPDLEGVTFKPIDQPPLPLTPEEELALAEKPRREKEDLKRIDELERRYKALTSRAGKGESLRDALSRQLSESEIGELGGENYFKRTFGAGRNKGSDISDFVSDGSLNAWIPPNLIIDQRVDTPEIAQEKEIEATEYIREKLRNRNYLTYEAEIEAGQIEQDLRATREFIEREAGFENLRDILADIYEEEIARGFEPGESQYAPTAVGEPAGTTRIETAQREAPKLIKGQAEEIIRPKSFDYFSQKAFDDVNQDYKSRSKIIEMPIDDFLALAEKGYDKEKAKGIERLIEKNKQFDSIPQLFVRDDSESGVSKVIGHEGRHRALALKERGFTTIPVNLRGDIRWSEQTDPQKFDYVEQFPQVIQAETKAADESFSIPYPVKRDQVTSLIKGPESQVSPQQREERAIADRERELFALQPQAGEKVGAPTADLFGARGLTEIPPKAPAARKAPEAQLNLFSDDKIRTENKAVTPAKEQAVDSVEATKIQKAIEGKSPIQVAKWISYNHPDQASKLISNRVINRMEKLMNAGVKFNFNVAHIGDRVPSKLIGAKGLSLSTIDQASNRLESADIWVNGADVTGSIGTSYETVLHELVHSVTSAANYLGRTKAMQGTNAAELSERLLNLSNAVIKHYNNNVKEFKAGRKKLTDFEQRVYNGANALDNSNEILAWGLTSKEMQDYLESIPYKGKNLWSEFVTAIRKFLGLPESQETALSELLSVSDEIFEAPLVEVGEVSAPAAPTKTAPIPTKEQIELFNAQIAKMKPSEALKALVTKKKPPAENLTAEGEAAKKILERLGSISNPKPKAADETLLKRLQGKFQPTDNISWEARIRRAVVDKDAPVIEQLQTKFNNAVKDELGIVRPDLSLMQGQDVSNFSDLMTQKGGIHIGKDGLINVFENKDANGKPINMDRVLELIAVDLGKKLGSADLAMQLAHNALIANRSNEILRNNARIENRAANLRANADSLMKTKDPVSQKLAKKMRSDADAMLKNVIEVRATREEIDAGLQAMRQYPEIQEAYDVFTQYKNNLVDFLRETGRISDLTAENWKENVGYVPWTRVEEEANKFENDPRVFKNGVVNLSALPKLDREGSSKEINNIFDNMVGLTYWAVRSGINNFAAQQTLNALPDVEVIAEDNVSEMRQKHPDRVVFSYRNGKREAYLLANPLQLSTFSTIAPIKGGMFSAIFAPAARFLRTTITHMPAFALSQLIQDGTYRAALLSGVKNPWKVPPRVFKNFYKALRKQKTGALGELERIGVSGIYDGMPEASSKKLRQRLNLEHRSAFKKAWDALEDFSLAADLAVRAAIYEQTMAETGDRALAYYRAKEYINFKRQGTDPIIYELRQSIPFFNAYLQGMDVLYRTMIGKGVSTAERKAAMKLFYMTGVQIAALNLIYVMMMSGDDDYEGLDDYVRNRNYILPGGFKLPVAPEVGFLFKVIPEQLYRAVMSEGVQTPQDATAIAKRLTGAFADAFGGIEYLPQLIKPIVEISTNYSFFLESPIVGAGLKNVDPKLQFTESTSELAKAVGGMSGISPVKLDYFIRAYTGMAGAMALELTDSLANPDRMGKPLYKTPQISTFMYDPTGRGFKSDFYKFREEIDKVADTVNMMKREGKEQELAKYLTEENATRYALRGMVNKVEEKLSVLRNYRKVIASDTTLSPSERRSMVREVLDQERELVKAYDVKELRKIAGF